MALAALLAGAPPAAAQICQVPGQRDSIQAAAKDPACAVVNVAAGSYPESVVVARSVWINGASTATTFIHGRVLLRGDGTVLELSNLSVDARGGGTGCYPSALPIVPGTTLSASAVGVLNGAGPLAPCPLFTDGFDYGD
jgi:hypothetical protein